MKRIDKIINMAVATVWIAVGIFLCFLSREWIGAMIIVFACLFIRQADILSALEDIKEKLEEKDNGRK